MDFKGKLMLIVNPVSGRRYAEKVLSEVCSICTEEGWMVTVFPTAGTGDAAEYVRRYGREFDRIGAMGGDGTLNQVLTGIVDAGLDLPVGYIPAGSTNDFATTQSIPTDVAKAARLLCGDSVTEVDIARFNDRCVAFHAAFGSIAAVVNNTFQDFKNVMGYFAYILEGAKDLSRFRPVHVRFILEDEVIEGNYIYGGLMSTTTLGGGIISFPQQLVGLSDGKYELFLIKCPRDLIDAGDMVAELAEGIYNGEYTTLRSVSSARVESDEDLVWSLDGEAYDGAAPISFEVLPRRIRLLRYGTLDAAIAM